MAEASNTYDRSAEDVGNVQMLEHVNVTVPDQALLPCFTSPALALPATPISTSAP